MGGSKAHGKRPPLVPLRHRRVQFLILESEKQDIRQQESETGVSSTVWRQSQAQPRNIGVPSPSSRASPTAKLQRQKSGDISASRAAPMNPGERPYFKIILFSSFVLTINASFINLITLHSAKAMASVHVTGMIAHISNFAATRDLAPLYE